MAYDKKTFLKEVTVICDTREKENKHITAEFDRLGIKYVTDKKLPVGDYSFIIQDRDFSLSCVIERKADIDEFYGNITKDRERIEKEFNASSSLINEFVLLIENCKSELHLRDYEIPDWRMEREHRKIKRVGEHCYSVIQSWQCTNRYCFRTLFVPDNTQTAAKMLETFYWYWRNFKKLTASRRNR